MLIKLKSANERNHLTNVHLVAPKILINYYSLCYAIAADEPTQATVVDTDFIGSDLFTVLKASSSLEHKYSYFKCKLYIVVSCTYCIKTISQTQVN